MAKLSIENVDVAGKTIMPGFVSAHDHLIASAWTNYGVQIYEAKDKADALAMIKAYADANPDLKVIQGIGWDKNMAACQSASHDVMQWEEQLVTPCCSRLELQQQLQSSAVGE